MARMNWLDGIAEVVEEPIEGVERPAGAAKRLPDGGIMREGTKGYEGVVGRTASKDFGTRMADVRVAYIIDGSVNKNSVRSYYLLSKRFRSVV